MYIMSSHRDDLLMRNKTMATEAPAPKPLGTIDFEETDFETARAALEEPPAGIKALTRPDPSEWSKRRRPAEARDRLLTPATETWLDRLPRDVRPIELPRAYPRIANQVADVWSDAASCMVLLEALMVDRRGGRRGFPSRVALELAALRDHRLAAERARR
jgi:hypothetical protein